MPISFMRRATTRSKKSFCCSAFWYFAFGIVISAASTVGAEKPFSTRMSREKLVSKSPARISNAALSPLSAMIKAVRRRLPAPASVRPRDLRAFCGSLDAVRQAGASPKIRPVSVVRARANHSTPPSRRTSSSLGMSAGAIRIRNRSPAAATAMPNAPPKNARSMVSVRAWRSNCARLAPSAMRIAESALRASARTSRRLATFTQNDQQDRADRAQQDQQAKAGLAHDRFLKRSDDCAQVDLLSGELRQLGSEAVQLGQCRLRRDPGLEPADDAVVEIPHQNIEFLSGKNLGLEQIRLGQGGMIREQGVGIGKTKPRWKHAHDNLGLVIQHDGGADDGGIGAVFPPPEAIAEEHHAVFARLVLARQKGAAERRLDAKRGKKIGGNSHPIHPFRLAVAGQAGPTRVDHRKVLERRGLFAPLGEVAGAGGPHSRSGHGDRFSQKEQALRFAKRQRTQQNAVDHRVDGRGGAETERQRQHHHRGKAGSFRQLPEGKTQRRKHGRLRLDPEEQPTNREKVAAFLAKNGSVGRSFRAGLPRPTSLMLLR